MSTERINLTPDERKRFGHILVNPAFFGLGPDADLIKCEALATFTFDGAVWVVFADPQATRGLHLITEGHQHWHGWLGRYTAAGNMQGRAGARAWAQTLDGRPVPAIDVSPFNIIVTSWTPRNPYAGGFGSRIPTRYKARVFDQRWRRVYIAQWSNAGTTYIEYRGQKFVVNLVGL
jgi:hypothetical protein